MDNLWIFWPEWSSEFNLSIGEGLGQENTKFWSQNSLNDKTRNAELLIYRINVSTMLEVLLKQN